MHVTLIKPPILMPRWALTTQTGVPPLGMAYLAGSLTSRGFDVACIDAIGLGLDSFYGLKGTNLLINGLLAEEIVCQIDLETRIIGLSCLFSNEWLYYRKLIRLIKKHFPETPIILGGEAATADYDYILKTTPEISGIIVGEGEDSFTHLCSAFSKKGELSGVPGFYYFEEGAVKGARGARMKLLDDIPVPDWSSIPVEEYLKRGLGQTTYNLRVMPMLASRGCPYLCTFCTSPLMWQPKWFSRSVNLVLDEIEVYIKKYGIEHVDFCDLTAIINKEWIKDFCEKFIERELPITWGLPSGTRSEALDEEVIPLLKKSGLERINFAPESGSSVTLKKIKKRVNLHKMRRSIKCAVKNGLKTKCTIIYGFPDHTFSECLSNLRFITLLAFDGVDDVACYPFVPYPGSELHKKLEEEEVIDKSDTEKYEMWLAQNIFNSLGHAKSYSQHIGDTALIAWIYFSMMYFYTLQFLFRPWRIITLIYRLSNKKPLTMLDNLIYSFLIQKIKGNQLSVKKKVEV